MNRLANYFYLIKENILLNALCFFLGFMSLNAYAEDDVEKETPSLEFLEYLGTFQSSEGKWVDPIEIEKMMSDTSNQQAMENDDE